MTTTRSLLVLLALSGCIRQTIPESTTTRIGPAGGTAYSADGKFRLIVPPDAVVAEVALVIQTDTAAAEAGQVSHVYRVGPPSLRFAVPATAELDAPAAWEGELTLRSEAALPLFGAHYDPAGRVYRALVHALDCATHTCAVQAACPEGAQCVGGRCQYSCSSGFDCASPTVCGEASPFCPGTGFECTGHRCGFNAGWPSRPKRPSEPAPVCTTGAFALFAAAAPPCGTRTCGQSCLRCDPTSPACMDPPGICDERGVCGDEPAACVPLTPDGWDDPPGQGVTFVLTRVAIGSGTTGFDLDGKCDAQGCVDNALGALGIVADDQLRQGLLGGEFLFIVELDGLDGPLTSDDLSMTVKLYGARDADDPFFPANNFTTPAGETTCCAFDVVSTGVGAAGIAGARWPARLVGGRISSTGPASVDLPVTLGAPPLPMLSLVRANFTAVISPAFGGIEDVVVGGVWPIRALTALTNPFCRLQNAPCSRPRLRGSLLELALNVAQPDIDLSAPPNGLDEFTLDAERSEITACRTACPGDCRTLTATTADQPGTCRGQPQLEDGFSIAFTGAGVPARIVGVR